MELLINKIRSSWIAKKIEEDLQKDAAYTPTKVPVVNKTQEEYPTYAVVEARDAASPDGYQVHR